MATVKPDNKKKIAKSARQPSQRRAVASVEPQVITALQRREMQDSLVWMVSIGKSYRWIARHTIGATRFGWLQRVATGKRDVKPVKADLIAVRRLRDLLQEQSDLDGRRLDYMLKMMQLLAELQSTITEHMRMERSA